MTLATTAFERSALAKAWDIVRLADLEDGVPSPSVTRFAEDADAKLDNLADELAQGTYAASPLIEVVIGSEERVLSVPGVRDRVVARAVLDVIGELVDLWLGPASYGYRPGLGVADAVAALAALRDEGLAYVLRSDVEDCFPSIDAQAAFRLLEALLPDDSLHATLEQLRTRPTRTPDGRLRHPDGLPQGCPLSPMLANLVLVDLDEALAKEGFAVVRYADDFTVATQTPADASEAARAATRLLDGKGLALSRDKTLVTSFDEGFTFLGEDFGPRYPPSGSARVETPDEKVVYVAHQGGRVRVGGGRLVVESKDDAELLSVPTGQVARLVLLGSVGLSAGARAWALASDVTVVFASRSGSYQGSLLSHSERWRADRIRAQLAFGSSDGALRLARSIVEAKVTKQRVVLQRFGRRAHKDQVGHALGELASLIRMLPEAVTNAEVMGLEGAAARVYFPVYGALFPEGLTFTERSRQPPQDHANAALSFLYTVLLGECVTALHAAGLDPAFGVLHAEQAKRPSLALDLLEEFRPLIVDQAVLDAARAGRFRVEHAEGRGTNGILLTKAGKGAILDAYEERMNTRTRGALPDFAGTWRRHVHRQAQRLCATITGSLDTWTGAGWR